MNSDLEIGDMVRYKDRLFKVLRFIGYDIAVIQYLNGDILSQYSIHRNDILKLRVSPVETVLIETYGG